MGPSVIWGSASCKVAFAEQNLIFVPRIQGEPVHQSNRKRQWTHQTMLHILSLLLLPLLICSAEAKFLFDACLAEDCPGWQIALTVLTIIFFTCVLVCLACNICHACRALPDHFPCCRREMKQREMEEGKTSSNIIETV